MAYRLSEDAVISVTSPSATDVGGTTAATAYVSMENFSRAVFFCELGTWNGSDDLDHFRIEQATDSSGTSMKELTTDASGGNYDTDSPLDADGDQGVIEIRAEDLDVDSGFDFIRGVVGEDGNSGTDDVVGVLIRYGAAYRKKEQQGAASASIVYADPNT
jgi:hypothetical protein